MIPFIRCITFTIAIESISNALNMPVETTPHGMMNGKAINLTRQMNVLHTKVNAEYSLSAVKESGSLKREDCIEAER